MGRVLIRTENGVEWVDENDPRRLALRRGSSTQTFTEAKPHISQAAGCMPDQVEEFNEELHRRGLSASLTYLPDGRLRATGKEAFKEHIADRGFFDAENAPPGT